MDANQTKINPSDRSTKVSEYYFSKKLKDIEQMRKAGADIINLGIGSPDLPPSKSCIEILNSTSKIDGNHGYQSYYGIPELREAFASWYLKYFKVELDPKDEILPLMGSKEGIMHISMAYVNPIDKVLVPNPGYPTYTSVTKLIGGGVLYYDLKEENQWYPDFQKLEDQDLSNVKMMWINYPHMPTGKRATRDLFDKLVKFAHTYNILLCNDNPYSFILNKEHLSLLSIDGAKEVALELNSLSKSHNMPGWRVGMLAGHKELISNVVKIKSNMDSGMFRPLQLAAADALNNSDDWYDSVNETYKKRRVQAERLLKLLKCDFEKSQVGLFLWGKIPSVYEDGETLTDIILQKAHVFITPGFIFGSQGDRYIRVSLCASEEQINNSIIRISKIL